MPDLVPVDHNPFAPGPKLLHPFGPSTESPLGLEMVGAGVPTKGAAKPELVPVEHNPFAEAPPPDAAKLAQFERLEKRGAPGSSTSTITGLYRDEAGKVRVIGEKAEPKETPRAQVVQQAPRAESKAEPETKAKIEYPAIVVAHENAQPEFVKAVESHYEKLPLVARRVLRDGGSRLYVGEKLTDHSPWIANRTPRGWPEGTSWEMVDGLSRDGHVHVARTYLDRFSGKFKASSRIEGVVNHESGHALDYHMGQSSRGEYFMRAYQRDRSKIVSDGKHAQELAYYLQAGDAGPSEAFAEIFAQIVGPGASYRKIGWFFPHADAYMRDMLQLGGSK